MIDAGYLTSYDGLVCEGCIDGRRVTAVSEDDLRDVYGYDRAKCEECKAILYDGLAA